jgi:hypothetical protein
VEDGGGVHAGQTAAFPGGTQEDRQVCLLGRKVLRFGAPRGLIVPCWKTKKPAGSGLLRALDNAYLDGQAASPGTLLARVMKPLNGPITLMASSLGPSNFKLPNNMAVAGFMSDFQLLVVACIW